MVKNISLLVLFFGFHLNLFSVVNFNDSLSKITIIAKDYKNKCIFFYLSSTNNPSVTLNSDGYGEIEIPIKQTLFVGIGTQDSIFFNLLLEPRYDITYLINNGNTTIQGNGCHPNNYLLNIKSMFNTITKASKKIEDADVFIDYVKTCDSKLNQFHKKFTDSIQLQPHILYILKKSTEAKLLLAKQKFLSKIDGNSIDSLNLENKLNLINNEIFRDSVLINVDCLDFLSFLMYNFDRTIGRNKIYTNCPNPNVYPILAFSEVFRSNKYSEVNKEFLSYCSLNSDLYDFGINPTVENLIEVFHQYYPKSKYNAFLKKDVEKFKNLTNNNEAPIFKGKTPNGKLVSLSDFKGKVVFIDVWATWCGPCKKELPYTHQVQEYFKSNKQVQVLYISIDSEIDWWKQYLKKNKQFDGLHINIDDSDFSSSYKITGVPRYILIDKNGLIIDAFCDKPSNGKVEEKINKALLVN